MAETGGATLRRWLIGALTELGGAAPRADVHARIEASYGDAFTPEDRRARRGRGSEAAWQNNVDSLYDRLKKQGVLATSQQGEPWRLLPGVIPVAADASEQREYRPRNPPWSEEELILALDLYLREGMLGDHDAHVVALSTELDALPIHRERPDAAHFRNANSVALKLANFASLDPTHAGKGMSRGGRRDAEMWQRFAGDEDTLAAAAAKVRSGIDWREADAVTSSAAAAGGEISRVAATELEALVQASFLVARHASTVEAVRREQRLVIDYAEHLRAEGHVVRRRRYDLAGSSLRSDLFDETDRVLYEAKGDLRRESVRMAVGQLLDYARLEMPRPRLAVLLPRMPTEDLLAFLDSVSISCVYKSTRGEWSPRP